MPRLYTGIDYQHAFFTVDTIKVPNWPTDTSFNKSLILYIQNNNITHTIISRLLHYNTLGTASNKGYHSTGQLC